MARKPRLWIPSEPYHLISRFVDREYRLLDETDRDALIRHITLANRRWDWRFLSYALMSSHVHYGVLAGHQQPGRFFQAAHGRFARHHQKRYGSIGPVFASRPKQSRVKRAKCRSLVAYHHRNPVEAGVVAHASESRWTSHRALTRRDPAPDFLDVPWVLDALGFDDTEAGRRELDEFVMDADLSDRAMYVHETKVGDEICGDPLARVIGNELWEALLETVQRELGLVRPLVDPRARRILCIVSFELTGASASEIAARVGYSPAHVARIIDATPSLDLRVACDKLLARFRRAA